MLPRTPKELKACLIEQYGFDSEDIDTLCYLDHDPDESEPEILINYDGEVDKCTVCCDWFSASYVFGTNLEGVDSSFSLTALGESEMIDNILYFDWEGDAVETLLKIHAERCQNRRKLAVADTENAILREENAKLRAQILELELRPPAEGGKEYEAAKARFEDASGKKE